MMADENTERAMLSLSELEVGVANRNLPITSVQPWAVADRKGRRPIRTEILKRLLW